VAKLWSHEVSRVFADRLINDEDKEWFQALLVEQNRKFFGGRTEPEQLPKICFSDILRLDLGKEYEEIVDFNKLRKVLEEKYEEFNPIGKLIFFDEAIQHILRIARVLRQPRGSIMLIGVGGSGK